MRDVATVLGQLDLSPAQAAEPFFLKVGPVSVSVFCPGPLKSTLAAYFSDALSPEPGTLDVHLLPGQTLVPDPTWTDWYREPGKTGRKDAIHDLSDGRLIKKVRSAVTFLQAQETAVAFGPLTENTSTVINFINTQILNACLRDGWHLCHAAAVTRADRTLAIAGLSGGGKSTSVLRLMDIKETNFVSNDRVLVRAGMPPEALGIPKHPRINPGTILGNPALHGMLSDARRRELTAMPVDALWALEDKHDLMISEVFGAGRFQFEAPLTDVWILNWERGADTPTTLTEVGLSERPDLMRAIVKSPGPFFQHVDGQFEPNGAPVDPAPYLQALRGVSVREVSGRLDFDALLTFGRDLFDA